MAKMEHIEAPAGLYKSSLIHRNAFAIPLEQAPSSGLSGA